MSIESIVEGLEGIISILKDRDTKLENISSRVAALEEEHCKGINVRRDQISANASFDKRINNLELFTSTKQVTVPPRADKIDNEWVREKAEEIETRIQAVEEDIESKARCFSDDLESVKSEMEEVPGEDQVREWTEEAIKEISREDFLEVLGGKAIRAEIQFIPE